jgi:integrase
VMSKYQTLLRTEGIPSRKKDDKSESTRMRAENTIRSHVDHLMAALNWAKEQKLISRIPEVRKPKRAKKSTGSPMKGRPITLEEFERMLAVAEKVVGEKVADSWKFYLRGLWTSGLRLSESMQLHWADRSKLRVVDLDSREPLLAIPAEWEKGNEDRLLAMAPEFVEFLRQVPEADRTGYVFDPRPRRARYGERLTDHRVGRIVTAIGKAAGVVVATAARNAAQRKFASAHDLRRSFGDRWARKVMPAVLQELMRHESIDTTMRYYVAKNAKSTSAALWEVHRQSGTQSGTHADHIPENSEPNASEEARKPR